MNAVHPSAELKCDDLAADLADAALTFASEYGATSASLEVELDLWHALQSALNCRRPALRDPDEAADVAYRTILSHRPTGAFVDLELGIWKAFHDRWPTGSTISLSKR